MGDRGMHAPVGPGNRSWGLEPAEAHEAVRNRVAVGIAAPQEDGAEPWNSESRSMYSKSCDVLYAYGAYKWSAEQGRCARREPSCREESNLDTLTSTTYNLICNLRPHLLYIVTMQLLSAIAAFALVGSALAAPFPDAEDELTILAVGTTNFVLPCSRRSGIRAQKT